MLLLSGDCDTSIAVRWHASTLTTCSHEAENSAKRPNALTRLPPGFVRGKSCLKEPDETIPLQTPPVQELDSRVNQVESSVNCTEMPPFLSVRAPSARVGVVAQARRQPGMSTPSSLCFCGVGRGSRSVPVQLARCWRALQYPLRCNALQPLALWDAALESEKTLCDRYITRASSLQALLAAMLSCARVSATTSAANPLALRST